jgi:multidrug resistance protein MdtO
MPSRSDKTSSQRSRSLFHTIAAELAPYPGRTTASLRDALGIVLALVLAMTLRTPGIALALALLFLSQRERPGLTLRNCIHITLGSALALALSLVFVQLTDGGEVARFLGTALGIFAAAFCMVATTEPLFFTIFSFYWFLDLAAWDTHRSATATVAAGLNSLSALALVMLCSAAIQYLFGSRHPVEDLRAEMLRRTTSLANLFRALAEPPSVQNTVKVRALRNAVLQFAHSGDLRMQELYDRIHDSSRDLALVPIGTQYRIQLLSRILEKTVLLAFGHDRPSTDAVFYTALADLCDRMRSSNHGAAPLPATAPPRLQAIHLEIRQYIESRQWPHEPPAFAPGRKTRTRLFLPGVFDQPNEALYALKLTLAAMVCYVFYNAIAWPGILTCVVTVLFTGLSSTGAMKQKQLYRFSGAAIGGALGIATVAFLFPNMDSITALAVVVGLVAMASSWVLRSPRMSYVGVQIGFAFFLTTVPTFSAATSISPARDRVIGISLGILVMWFIFDQLWPVRTSTALHHALDRIHTATAQLRTLAHPAPGNASSQTLVQLRIVVARELATMQGLESAIHFDVGKDHRRELASTRRLIRHIEAAAGSFYNEALRLSEPVA